MKFNLFLEFVLILFFYCYTQTEAQINLQCGGISRYLVSNMNGQGQQDRCVYRIQPSNLYVCQLRVNITLLMLDDPDVGPGSSCSNDKFIVGGHKFELCGLIADQHFYIPIDGSNLYSQVEFEIQTKGGDRLELTQYLPVWQFTVQQLQCPPGMNRNLLNRESANVDKIVEAEQHANSMLRTAFNDGFLLAPRGCFQYYPNPSGVIKSFGEKFYLPKMDYAICIGRRNADKKLTLSGVVITMDGEEDDKFNYNEKCLNDYVYIQMGKVTPPLDPAPGDDMVYKLCGHAKSTINKIESEFPGLFMLTFKSDDDLTDVLKEERFRFSYSVS